MNPGELAAAVFAEHRLSGMYAAMDMFIDLTDQGLTMELLSAEATCDEDRRLVDYVAQGVGVLEVLRLRNYPGRVRELFKLYQDHRRERDAK